MAKIVFKFIGQPRNVIESVTRSRDAFIQLPELNEYDNVVLEYSVWDKLAYIGEYSTIFDHHINYKNEIENIINDDNVSVSYDIHSYQDIVCARLDSLSDYVYNELNQDNGYSKEQANEDLKQQFSLILARLTPTKTELDDDDVVIITRSDMVFFKKLVERLIAIVAALPNYCPAIVARSMKINTVLGKTVFDDFAWMMLGKTFKTFIKMQDNIDILIQNLVEKNIMLAKQRNLPYVEFGMFDMHSMSHEIIYGVRPYDNIPADSRENKMFFYCDENLQGTFDLLRNLK